MLPGGGGVSRRVRVPPVVVPRARPPVMVVARGEVWTVGGSKRARRRWCWAWGSWMKAVVAIMGAKRVGMPAVVRVVCSAVVSLEPVKCLGGVVVRVVG